MGNKKSMKLEDFEITSYGNETGNDQENDHFITVDETKTITEDRVIKYSENSFHVTIKKRVYQLNKYSNGKEVVDDQRSFSDPIYFEKHGMIVSLYIHGFCYYNLKTQKYVEIGSFPFFEFTSYFNQTLKINDDEFLLADQNGLVCRYDVRKLEESFTKDRKKEENFFAESKKGLFSKMYKVSDDLICLLIDDEEYNGIKSLSIHSLSRPAHPKKKKNWLYSTTNISKIIKGECRNKYMNRTTRFHPSSEERTFFFSFLVAGKYDNVLRRHWNNFAIVRLGFSKNGKKVESSDDFLLPENIKPDRGWEIAPNLNILVMANKKEVIIFLNIDSKLLHFYDWQTKSEIRKIEMNLNVDHFGRHYIAFSYVYHFFPSCYLLLGSPSGVLSIYQISCSDNFETTRVFEKQITENYLMGVSSVGNEMERKSSSDFSLVVCGMEMFFVQFQDFKSMRDEYDEDLVDRIQYLMDRRCDVIESFSLKLRDRKISICRIFIFL